MSNQNCPEMHDKFLNRKDLKAHETITWTAVEN